MCIPAVSIPSAATSPLVLWAVFLLPAEAFTVWDGATWQRRRIHRSDTAFLMTLGSPGTARLKRPSSYVQDRADSGTCPSSANFFQDRPQMHARGGATFPQAHVPAAGYVSTIKADGNVFSSPFLYVSSRNFQ